MTYCGERTLVKLRPDRREATTLKCRSWLCPDCYEQRKAALIAQAHRGKANTFITITSKRESWPSADQAALELANAWRICVKRALREARRDPKKNSRPFGAAPRDGWGTTPKDGFAPMVRLEKGRLEYLAVIEAHKSGWPHLHIISRSRWITHKWLSAQMDDLLGSPVVSVSRIEKRSAKAAYIAKYCGKCTHKFGTAKRYWQTRGFQLTRYEKPESIIKDWHEVSRDKRHLFTIATEWTWHGFIVRYESNWHLVAERPPDSS